MDQKYDGIKLGQEARTKGSQALGATRDITVRPFTSWYLSSMFDEDSMDEKL